MNHKDNSGKKSGLLRILLLLFLCYGGNTLYAQNQTDLKEKKITLRVSNEPLGKVLEMAAQAANATLTIQGATLVGIDKPTTINADNIPLDKVLGELIGDQNVQIRYEGGNQIVIESYKTQLENELAQHLHIEGTVIDKETQEPLIGATIMITDGTKDGGVSGTITDIDGKFSLYVPRRASVRISYIGYESTSMQILNPSPQLEIYLSPNTINIDEVVITGISKRNKSSFTGNYVSVKGEDLRKISPVNILKGLEFFDPSFKILESNSSGSDPNARPEFIMRGDQMLGSSRELSNMELMLDNVSSRPNVPLFVLDGFIVPMSRVLELDPERVGSITILKDASATSIYGSRASNGVVVVETRVAPDGALSISYNGNYTVQAPDLSDYNMMNAAEKLEAEKKAGIYPENNVTMMNEYNRYLRNVLAGVDTYWLSQPLRTAFQYRHSLSAARRSAASQ